MGGAGVAVEIRGLRREEKLEGKGACVSKEREGKGGKGGKRGKVVDWRACKALCSPERSIFGELLLASRLNPKQRRLFFFLFWFCFLHADSRFLRFLMTHSAERTPPERTV